MIPASVRAIADAVLYEGYMLYPYRPSSVKNRQRWTFGGLYPEAWAAANEEPAKFVSEMLIESPGEAPQPEVVVRFLQLVERDDGVQEATPRETGAGAFEFAARKEEAQGYARRSERLAGSVDVATEAVPGGLYRLRITVTNRSESPADEVRRDAASMFALVAAHAIVRLTRGSFVSLTDPPEVCRAAAEACRNQGVWPVLVGEAGWRDAMLAAPIILYDYPQIAPESAGDLFDGTEIDEILSLRILTLTDEEKDEMRRMDPRTRELLDRTESLSAEQLMRMHGVLRSPHALDAGSDFFGERPKLESVRVFGVDLKRGDRVRLWPQKSADIMDMALAGKIAEIESIEQDFDEQIHLAVTIDDDPGKDLGMMRQPGHRFFFSPEEVEPLSLETA